ncbi:uncharacterized protein LOC129791706 [Lutzomyia longipalpis]|uniref:uncharacterized protein LOC129791706 n=1 Tax=Lutzomyia longipalpis TaxID=7200 RepID=UPI0024842635|nr:uncharacterized protein LOC129791706 [Lutzomyia longipalpis]
MFRQIKVFPHERDLQRILWRENQWEDVKEYTLNTVTYGTACATFLSVKVIQQLAIDEGHHFPKAKAAMKDFYVDDVLTGAHSLQEAREVRDQLIGLMSRGGMNLRKWTASDPRLLEDLPQNQIESKYLNLTDDEVLKALGVGWNPITDKIQYTVRAPTAGQLTKRKILSDVAAIFDPIGLLAPIMIAAKMFVQRLWKEKLDWDDPIPSIIADEWNTFLHNLPDIGKIEIERFFGYEPGSNVQLHGFADASEKGFGAVIYVRVSTRETTKVTILTAKTRVTPLKKKISLPRLELCGGVLLAELMDNTEKALQIPGIEKHAWLDSKIALAWIAKDAANWETYIANRVEKIHQLVNRNVWKHVESAQNPADIASRGICPSQLSQNALWWNGPSWLSRNEREWPVNENDTPPAKAEDRENSCTTTNKKEEDDQRNVMGHQAVCALSTEGGDKAVQNPLTMKYDSLNKAIRITAYCKRFLQLCRGEKPETPHLSSKELNDAELILVKQLQEQHFEKEIQLLSAGRQIPTTNKLLTLDPFLDENGILRPHKEQVLDSSLTRNRVFCTKKMYQMLQAPKTPTSPTDGSTTGRPGHTLRALLTLRGRLRRALHNQGIQRPTKAIHLELVSELTTQAFLAALDRFTARRGKPTKISSDNGTNFVGAKNALDKEVKKAFSEATQVAAEHVAKSGIHWELIPPASPHFGGLWEAGVKSTKRHLKAVLTKTILTFEEFYTVLTSVEAALNSRPLTPLSEDAHDLAALSPGHFLIGRELLAPPQEIIEEREPTRRWRLVKKLQQDVWKRWVKEYLHHLQERNKWKKRTQPIKTGELVLIMDDNTAPLQWPLARVEHVLPDKAGLPRVADLRTATGTKRRPITKIARLPIYQEDNPIEEAPVDALPWDRLTLLTRFIITHWSVRHLAYTSRSSGGPKLKEDPFA